MSLPTLFKAPYDNRKYDIDLSALMAQDGGTIASVVSITADTGGLTFGSPAVNGTAIVYSDHTAPIGTVIQINISGGVLPLNKSSLSCTITVRVTSTTSPDQLQANMVLILANPL